MKLKVMKDPKRGEVFFFDTSLFVWNRYAAYWMQTELERLIGPVTHVLFRDATRKVMTELFVKIERKHSSLRKQDAEKYLRKVLDELMKFGYGVFELASHDSDGNSVVRVHNSFNAYGYPRQNKPVCYRVEGILASMFEVFYGSRVAVKEQKCIAKGDDCCEFIVFRLSAPCGIRKTYPSAPKKGLNMVEYDLDRKKGEIRAERINAVLFPRSDAKALEKETERIVGPTARSLFYLVGKKGGKSSGSQMMGTRYMQRLARLFKGKALDKLAEMAIALGVGVIFTKYSKGKSEVIIRLHNSANAVNAGKTSKPACYTFTGLFTGVLELIFGREMRGEEVKCIAKGDKFCEFRAAPVKRKGK